MREYCFFLLISLLFIDFAQLQGDPTLNPVHNANEASCCKNGWCWCNRATAASYCELSSNCAYKCACNLENPINSSKPYLPDPVTCREAGLCSCNATLQPSTTGGTTTSGMSADPERVQLCTNQPL